MNRKFGVNLSTGQGTSSFSLASFGFESFEDFKQQNKTKIKVETNDYNNVKITMNSASGTYDHTLNIRKIHDNIVSKFKDIDYKEIELLEAQKKELQLNYKNCNSINQLNYYSKKIKEIDVRIENVKTNKLFKEYSKTVKKLLYKFEKLNKKLQKEKDESDDEEDNEENTEGKNEADLSNLIETYIESINSDTFDINLKKKVGKRGEYCSTCKKDLQDVEDEGGVKICPQCYTSQPVIVEVYKNEISTSFKLMKTNTPENEKNYRKAIINFNMDQQTDKLPSEEKLISILDGYFEVFNPSCLRENVINKDFDRWIRKGTSVIEMIKALKAVKLNEFYDDVNLICKIYWGWKKPGISHLTETLLKRHRGSRESYNRHKGDRGSAMNVNYELYHDLRRLEFNCKETDFKMISTEGVILTYKKIRKKIEKDMGWD